MTLSQVGEGDFVFDFDDRWFEGEHHSGHTDGWAHHGVVVTSAGEVVTFDEKLPRVLVLGRDGSLVRTFDVDLVEGHGMVLVREGDEELLWISDNGSKRRRRDDGTYEPDVKPLRGSVAQFRLDGTEVFRLKMPALPVYAAGDYCPTAVAVDEEQFGGGGDIWVADGYGQMVVHRFDNAGTYLMTIDGTTGAGRFTHPHAVYIDRRDATPELLVADRRNKRIQVFDLEGRFVRSFGEDFLVSPSGFAGYGDNLLVTELNSRITILGPDNKPRAFLGHHEPAAQNRPGWPNEAEHGKARRPQLRAGTFNTPHGVAVDAGGSIYVTEWLIGGRLVKLTPPNSR
ncbi:hypothetical protein AB0H36_47420 [Kribbella sp. NPDC050820]|uniref:hypothetical protein n=1 Tax=Kribbella sp. NPDC050820 TaxID=3155408 RepID=UPI0033F91ECD